MSPGGTSGDEEGEHPSTDPTLFRSVLGHFATGLVIVTCADAGGPIGFTAQSFSALSLDPPLVLFCPSKSSTTWPSIRQVGTFCVNVLGDDQQELCQRFAVSGGPKFEDVGWTSNAEGLPLLNDCIAYIECSLYEIHDAGDHEIAIGRVLDLRPGRPSQPLVYFRGMYRQLLHTEDPPA